MGHDRRGGFRRLRDRPSRSRDSLQTASPTFAGLLGLAIVKASAESYNRLNAEAIDAQSRLSSIYVTLGDVQKARGNLVGALENYRRGLAIGEKLSAADAANMVRLGSVGIDYRRRRCTARDRARGAAILSAEGALGAPATGQDLEALLIIGSTDDLDHEVEIGGLVHELQPILCGVGEQMPYRWPALADAIQDRLAPALSDLFAGVRLIVNNRLSVSTSMWRLRPTIFLSAS